MIALALVGRGISSHHDARGFAETGRALDSEWAVGRAVRDTGAGVGVHDPATQLSKRLANNAKHQPRMSKRTNRYRFDSCRRKLQYLLEQNTCIHDDAEQA